MLFSIILVSPIAIALFFFQNKEKWCFDEEDKCNEEQESIREYFEQKYGTVLEGMKKGKRSVLVYIIIFAIRRILMTFLVIIPSFEISWLQIFFSILLSMISLSYLLLYKPF